MRKRSFLLALAAGLLTCSFGTINAMAGTVPVYEDGGTFSFVLTAPKGGGSFTIDYSNALLSTINFAAIPTGSINALLPAAAPHTVTSTTTVGSTTFYTITQPAPNIKEFGVGPGAILTASLEYELNTGVAVNPGFLNLSGNITGRACPLVANDGNRVNHLRLFGLRERCLNHADLYRRWCQFCRRNRERWHDHWHRGVRRYGTCSRAHLDGPLGHWRVMHDRRAPLLQAALCCVRKTAPDRR